MPASTQPSLKIVKSFSFRGVTRLWSNRYYMTGPIPSNSTKWTTLADAVVTAEKACLHAQVTIVEAFGYAAGSDVPVFTKTYATAGLITPTGELQQGEVAALVRYSTATRTSKNHPLYLFNYYHRVVASASPNTDTLWGTHRTAFQTYASAWVTGFNDGTNVQVRCGPNGDIATGISVDTFMTHRDFPRG